MQGDSAWAIHYKVLKLTKVKLVVLDTCVSRSTWYGIMVLWLENHSQTVYWFSTSKRKTFLRNNQICILN